MESGHKKIDMLRALEVFIAAADKGSMTIAARQLKITQSAISQQLKLLESEMRVKLIDRDKRPLRLTAAGHALRHRGAKILIEVERLRSDVRQITSQPLANLRIAIYQTLAPTLAPALERAVVDKTLPVDTLSILRGMASQHSRDLPYREVDVVITSNALVETQNFERHDLIHENFLLITPKGAMPRDAGLRELAAKLPMVRYSARTEMGRAVEQHLRRLRLNPPLRHTFESAEDLFSMIGLGQGWAITAPTHVVQAMRPSLAIELRPLPNPGFGRYIVLVARRDELGALPKQIANLCRWVLNESYLPRVRALIPEFADHIAVTADAELDDVAT